MGMAKRQLEESEVRGWVDVGTVICNRCVYDQALKTAITTNGTADICDYCNDYRDGSDVCVPIEVVLNYVVSGLNYEYEDPLGSLTWDGGFRGADVHDTWDLLLELEITERENVHKVLHDSITIKQWCQRNPQFLTPTAALLISWEDFREYVKHTRRFTFLDSDASASEDSGVIPAHKLPAIIARFVFEEGLVRALPANSEWWRVRVHDEHEEICATVSELGSPPNHIARDNRMTPKGIGAFYGASTASGAEAEVAGYVKSGQSGTISKFSIPAPLTVVDLRDAPPLPSLFDPEERHRRAHINFLHGFIDDTVKIADPNDTQDLDYVPTQIIAETLRYALGVDGILWRSSKDENVTSCVLFIANPTDRRRGKGDTRKHLMLDESSIERIQILR